MKRLFWKRVEALMLASVLGVTGIFGYERFADPNEVYAAGGRSAEDGFQIIEFAEGEGTGKDFSQNSWRFSGQYSNGDLTEVKEIKEDGIKPGIYENEYSAAHEDVIRLISGVRSKKDEEGKNNGWEADDLFNPWLEEWKPDTDNNKSVHSSRSGKAMLNVGGGKEPEPIQLDEHQSFALKFTVSMPEAVLESDELVYSEYGGDGIAFVMTSKPGQDQTAGSGIGYGGMENCFAIELDSYYNGSLSGAFNNSMCDEYYRWAEEHGYDENHRLYVNEGHVERFDHVAITLNGNTQKHEKVFYLNGMEPKLENLAFFPENDGKGIKAQPDDWRESTCATRFTDVNVNDRLFTVWVEYDGTNMDVSYANGDFANAQRPEEPQITYEVDLKDYFGEENDGVYMGFTSAIARSKANHTIHAFWFTNKPETSYSVEYYFQQSDGRYEKDENRTLTVSEIEENGEKRNVRTAEVVSDTEYQKEFVGYTYATVADSVNKTQVRADGSSVLKLYYDAVPTAGYEIKYYKLDPNTGKYVEVEEDAVTGEGQKGNVGDTVNIADVDSGYEDKYEHHKVNEEESNLSVELNEEGKTYTLEVYYDPEETTYKTEYYVKNSDGGYTLDSTEISNKVYVGKAVEAEIPEKEGYEHVTIPGMSNEKATVEADGATVLKVYYDDVAADKAEYEIKYYKLNPNTGKYEEADTVTGERQNGNVGDTVTVADVDSGYENKYDDDHYKVNKDKNEKWSVELTEEDQSCTFEVYYDPEKTTYTTEYYVKNPDGSYTLEKRVESSEVYVGKTVQAEIPEKEGYTHVIIPGDSKEEATVEAGGTTVLKVYYDAVVAGTVKYRVDYYKLNLDTERYTRAAIGEVQTGNVGDIITLENADSAYAGKYTADYYEVNTTKNEKWSVELTAENQTYVLEVYYDPVKTTYTTEYYLKKADGTVETISEEDEAYVGETVQAKVPEKEGYRHVIVPDESKEEATVEPGGTTVMKVYYEEVPLDAIKYRTDYYKLNPNTGEYVKVVTGEEQIGNVGDTITLTDVDSAYADKYTADHYEVNTTKNEKWSMTLEAEGQTYVLEVYYDPVKTTYTTEYWVQKPDGSYEKKETVTTSDVYVGKTVEAEIPDKEGCEHVIIPGESKEEATVEPDGTTVLKVYYKEVVAAGVVKYRVDYYKLNPDTEKYEKAATGTEQTGNVGDIINLTNVDSAYVDKYTADYYVVNTAKNGKWSVELAAEDQTYVLEVYYDPLEVTYEIEYYLKKPDGTVEKKTERKKAYVGKKVQAEIPDEEGYIHVITGDSLETAVVTKDGTTVLKVYYEAKAPSVKPPVEKPSPKPAEKDTGVKPIESPLTGDSRNYIWLIMLLAAAIGGYLTIGRMKKE